MTLFHIFLIASFIIGMVTWNDSSKKRIRIMMGVVLSITAIYFFFGQFI